MEEENGIDLQAFAPSWSRDGVGIGQPNDYDDEDIRDWDTNAWTRDTPDVGEVRGSGCSAPDTGTWIWGAIDGECQWIDTTTCS